MEVETASKTAGTKISNDGIRNFLSAVCDIVVYDLKHEKNFAAIKLVLEKLKKDKSFSQVLGDNAEILKQKISDDIGKITSKDEKNQSEIYNNFKLKVHNCCTYEFCLFVSFFLPEKQRDQLQNEILKKYYEEKEFLRKIPPSLKQYLSTELETIIFSNNNQQINTESNGNSSHYEIEKIRNDDDEFNNDKELQRLYIKLLKVIRDDIALGDDETYKQNKNKLLQINNTVIKEIGNIQKIYKQTPGWLRSEFEIGWLNNFDIRKGRLIKKSNNQTLTYTLSDTDSGNKIVTNINNVSQFLKENNLCNNKQYNINISIGKICLMNFLSFFYYVFNLKFFVDVFKLDMRKEDFMILFPLLIGVLQIAGFVYFPFVLPMVHFFSAAFGFVFLAFDLLIYREKFISSKDIVKYNSDLDRFSSFVNQKFENENITLQKESVGKSQKYDKIIDGYEEKYKNNIRISSGYHESGSCDCNCDCDCPSAEECLCGCLNACAQDPHCCECVGLCCLMLVCPLCIPCIAGGRQL